MHDLAVTRRALLQGSLAGGALLSLPWSLSFACEAAYLAFISECAESATFGDGLSRVLAIDQRSDCLHKASNLSVELGRAVTGRVLGLLDYETYSILESHIHARGGKTVFVGRHGIDHVVEGAGSRQNLCDCLGIMTSDNSNTAFADLFEKSGMEGIGELIAKIAINTRTGRPSITNSGAAQRDHNNPLISFVAKI